LKDEVEKVCNRNNLKVTIEIIGYPLDILCEEAVSYYDIILLDIEMPYISGFDIANKINNFRRGYSSPYIVFVTSQEHLVFEALKCFPYSFVRKNSLKDLEPCLIHIYEILDPVYAVKSGRESVVVRLKDLLYMEKHGNYVDFITANKIYQERTSIDAKLKDLDKYGFIKVHSGALVNVAHITAVSNDCVRMSNNKQVPVSRTYKKSFKEKLQNWMVKM